MTCIKDFINKLSRNIRKTNESNPDAQLSFAHFLCLLDDESFDEYNNLINKAITGNIKNDECIQKAKLIYTSVIKEIEKKESNVIIDLENKWLVLLFNFLRVENLYRQLLIEGYEGFLYDGKIKLRSNKHLEVFLNT